MPLAFQLTFDGTTAANSQATKPRFRVYAPGPGGACVTSVPANGSGYLFLADDDNVSSGNSLWQYFPTSRDAAGVHLAVQLPGEEPDYRRDAGRSGATRSSLEIPAFGQTVGFDGGAGHQTEHQAAVRAVLRLPS